MTHQITGVGLAAVSVAALDVPTQAAAAVVGAAWLGSMLPDADRAGARVHRRTRLERRMLLVRALGALARVPLRLLILLRHRGPTHSLFGCALAAAGSAVVVWLAAPALAPAVAAGVAIGYLAHLAGDACTPAGVAFWTPISRRRHWLLPAPARVPTGSLREYALAALLAVALTAATVLLSG